MEGVPKSPSTNLTLLSAARLGVFNDGDDDDDGPLNLEGDDRTRYCGSASSRVVILSNRSESAFEIPSFDRMSSLTIWVPAPLSPLGLA